jgi:hypothetical protein
VHVQHVSKASCSELCTYATSSMPSPQHTVFPTEGRRPREVYHTNFCFSSDFRLTRAPLCDPSSSQGASSCFMRHGLACLHCPFCNPLHHPFMPRQARFSEQERRSRRAERQSTLCSSLSQAADLDGLARQRVARARDTDRQRVRRQSLADASDPDDSSRRQARLERARELQRLRRIVVRGCVTTRLFLPPLSPFLPRINTKRSTLFSIAWSVFGVTSGSVRSA